MHPAIKPQGQLTKRVLTVLLGFGLLSFVILALPAILSLSALPVLKDMPYGKSFAFMLRGFAPKTYKDGTRYGSGVYFAPHEIKLYEKPDEKSTVLDSFNWTMQDGNGATIVSTLTNRPTTLRNVFFCFYPDMEVAMMAVVGESAGLLADGTENTDAEAPVSWVEVVYDQKAQKSGWVKLREENGPRLGAAHLGVYQTWLDFMKLNAKPVGVYWLAGVSQYNHGIRMSDKDESPMIKTTIVRDLKVKHVRGNWLLVEVLDFEHNTPIGWVRWRDNDGNLMVFPNLSQEKPPVVVTGN